LSAGIVGVYQNGPTGEMNQLHPEDGFNLINDGLDSLAATIDTFF
jgi:hypothetical protein